MISHDHPGSGPHTPPAVPCLACGNVSSSKQTPRSHDGEIMRSLPLCEKWRGQRWGCPYHLFAWQAVGGRAQLELWLTVHMSPHRPSQEALWDPSQQKAEELFLESMAILVGVINQSLETGRFYPVWTTIERFGASWVNSSISRGDERYG